jgi:nucleolar complex protein 2
VAVVEIYRLDPTESYQHAFVYIRQLAIHLRGAIVTKKKESFAQVYNWQFLSSLKVLVSSSPLQVG